MSLHTTLLGSSATVISGRGLAHRKLTFDEKVNLAADCVTGLRPYQPSIEHASTDAEISGIMALDDPDL
jgi:hypothetical protein